MVFDYKTQYHHYKHYFLKIGSIYQQPVAKISLSLILALLTISFFALFAIKPAFTTIAQLTKELKDKKQVNQKLEKKVDNLKQAQKNYTEIEKDIIFVDRALPKTPNFNQIAGQINYLTYNHNLLLNSASFSEFELISSKINENSLVINLSITGSFQDVKSFLKDLEALDRIIKIKSISFTSKTKMQGVGVQTKISGEIFWLTEEGENSNAKEKSN